LLESEVADANELRALQGRSAPSRVSRAADEDGTAAGFATVLDVGDRSLTLDLAVVPTRRDLFLAFSLHGERIQIERRMEARRRILEGRSANPSLGQVIEEGGCPPAPARRTRIEPLSMFVREKVFSRTPTRKQEEAIRIALNTPDIALIQ